MKREEIIEILGKYTTISVKEDDYLSPIHFEAIADELQVKELSDEEIHFAGKERYDCDIVPDGEDKQKIIKFANIWREGAKWYREQIKQL